MSWRFLSEMVLIFITAHATALMALEEADDADRKVYAELMGQEIERFQSLQKRKKILNCGLNRKHTKIIAY